MKKILLVLFLVIGVAGTAIAKKDKDMKMAGKVKSVDANNGVFVIETVEQIPYTFAITPMTDIEYEDRLFDGAELTDLSEGVWVTVEYFPGQKVHTADEIKIYEEMKTAK